MNFVEVTVEGTGDAARLVGPGRLPIPVPPRYRAVAGDVGRQVDRRRLPSRAPRARRHRWPTAARSRHDGRRRVPRQRGAPPRQGRGPGHRGDRRLGAPRQAGRRPQANLPLAKLHLFDAETGETLRPSARRPPVAAPAAADRPAARLTGRPTSIGSAPEDPSGADLVERVVDSRVLHQGRYLTFRVDTIERADGTRAERDVAGHPGAVAILAIDEDDRVLLVRQFRCPAGASCSRSRPARSTSRPDGSVEDPDLAARRELEEETGYRAGSWRRLGQFWTAPGFTSELMHLYLATDLDAGRPTTGSVRTRTSGCSWCGCRGADAVAAAERGEIADAKSIVGLFWLARLRGG